MSYGSACLFDEESIKKKNTCVTNCKMKIVILAKWINMN